MFPVSLDSEPCRAVQVSAPGPALLSVTRWPGIGKRVKRGANPPKSKLRAAGRSRAEIKSSSCCISSVRLEVNGLNTPGRLSSDDVNTDNATAAPHRGEPGGGGWRRGLRFPHDASRPETTRFRADGLRRVRTGKFKPTPDPNFTQFTTESFVSH